MQRIAGSYLLASPRFSENLSSAPAGKDQGLSFADIFSHCINTGNPQRIKTGNMAEKPMLSRTVLNHQNTLAAKQQTAVKERTSSGNDDGCKALDFDEDRETCKASKENSSENPAMEVLQDIHALLDLYLNNEEISGEVSTEADKEIIGKIFRENGESGPTEALKQLLQERLIELDGLIENLDDNGLRMEVEEVLLKFRHVLGEASELFSEVQIEFEVSNNELNHEEVFAQLKALCIKLIDKLNKPETSGTDDMLTEDIADTIVAGAEADLKVAENTSGDSKEETAGIFKRDPEESKINRKTAAGKDEGNFNKAITEQNISENLEAEDMLQMNFSAAQDYKVSSAQESKTQVQFAGIREPIEQSVTNQVMTKVKIMAGEGRQEMEMELKPETLGKLSMRIIHEKGEILAKITAESERVKQILESNMQMLKDSLEENGFSVQSLSVSVGNEKEEQAGDGRFESDRPGSKIKVSGQNHINLKEVEAPYTSGSLNYLYSDSQIDLTA